jgi:hypothetical protein
VRGRYWEPRLFWAVPLVVCIFSYLYCVCALIGLITRSTLAAVLLTLLFWIFLFGVHFADVFLLDAQFHAQREVSINNMQYKLYSGQLDYAQQHAGDGRGTPGQVERLTEQRRHALDQRQQAENVARNVEFFQRVIVGFKTLLPKTSETSQLLERWLLTPQEKSELYERGQGRDREARPSRNIWMPDEESGRETRRALGRRSVAWVIGSSLGFEAAVLALCLWLFGRRDF